MLLDQGYLVVKFDHRASTAISKELENHILNAMSGPIERKDIVDGIKWLKSQPYTDPIDLVSGVGVEEVVLLLI
ncbi:hypothetical protein CM15mP5_3220 [bacterium]|nr:MAG: hypothetical protein CM15mP5_3220 [bacterium]